jgi:hypothetical protein
MCLLAAATSASANVTLTDPIEDVTINEDVIAENQFNLNNHFSNGESVLSFSAISEEITFFASDGDQKVSDSIYVTVEPDNDAPILISPLINPTPFNEDSMLLYGLDLHNHFFDIDSLLIFTYSSENIIVTINSNGYVDFSAPSNWFGSEEVVFSAHDGGFTISDTVTVTVNPVNDPPQCNVNFKSISLKGATHSKTLHLGDYFMDVEDEKLTYKVTGNSQIKSEINAQNGDLAISAPKDWSGKEVIFVTASDSKGATRSMQVVVVVSPASNSQGQVFYLIGIVLGLSVVGCKLQFTGKRRIVKSPVKLESYRHFKGN